MTLKTNLYIAQRGTHQLSCHCIMWKKLLVLAYLPEANTECHPKPNQAHLPSAPTPLQNDLSPPFEG